MLWCCGVVLIVSCVMLLLLFVCAYDLLICIQKEGEEAVEDEGEDFDY